MNATVQTTLLPSTPSARWIPAFTWLRSYQRRWLRADLIAGITLAAYLLPAGIGDASLANLPPEAGLYACLFSGLVFWLFCSSRHTSITVTSAISLLVGASVAPMAGGDASRFASLAACLALLVAIIAFIAWLIKAGAIVNFISEPVMLGAVETAAIGRMFCAKHGGRFDGNQELLALASANLAAGLGRSFPVSGGMSQSLVNESAGARTPLSGLIAAVIILLVTLFLSGLLYDLPQPALAAIVLFAVAGLFKLKALIRL